MLKRFLLALALVGGFAAPAFAQVPCVGANGINSVSNTGIVCGQEPQVATYSGTGVGIAPASSATDIACLSGSSTLLVRVQRVIVSGTAATSIIVPAVLKKHTVANTGTSSAITATKLDSTIGNATGSAISYAANPTIDSSATNIAAANLVLTKNDLTGGAAAPATVFDFTGSRYSTAPVLRGTAQQVCVNLNGTSPATGAVNVTFTWTESKY